MSTEPESSLAELGRSWLGSVDSVTFDEIANARSNDRPTTEPIRRTDPVHTRTPRRWLFAGAAALVLLLVGALAQFRPGNNSQAPQSPPTASQAPTAPSTPVTPPTSTVSLVDDELSSQAAAVTEELADLRLTFAVGYSIEQQWTISSAVQRIENQCLTDRGFDYAAEVPSLAYEIDEAQRLLKAMRFDDRGELERSGYSLMQSQTQDYDQILGVEDDAPSSPSLDSALQACAAVAAEEISPGAGGVMTHLPNDLDAAQGALSDEVRSETADLRVEWTACMINGGFGNTENIPVMRDSAPNELNDHTEAEWAVADYDCRETTGITAERLRIREEFITAYIAENQEELTRLSELQIQETARALQVLES